MEREELVRRLEGHEWTDIEFKEARRGVPEAAHETVSAFSNAEGGWLVFGVRDGEGGSEIVGVLDVDKVQSGFLSVLRSGQKLNHVVAEREWLIDAVGAGGRYALAEHPRGRPGRIGRIDAGRTGLVTDQPDAPAPNLAAAQAGNGRASLSTAQVRRPPTDLSTAQAEAPTELSATHWAIMDCCDVPRRLTEIMAALDVANRGHFKKHYLDLLIRGGIVAMTRPDRPSHPDQAYVLTDAGAALKARRKGGG